MADPLVTEICGNGPYVAHTSTGKTNDEALKTASDLANGRILATPDQLLPNR